MASTGDTSRKLEPWHAASTRADRARRIVPFLLVLGIALGLVLLPPGEPGRFNGIAFAAGGFALCGLLLVVVPWERLPAWPRLGVVALYCSQVAVVREATGGGRSGFAIMLLLAVVWHAVYGRTSHLVATLAMIAATLILPVVLIGEPAYTGSEWRKALLLCLVGGVVGIVVQRLVHRVQDERWVVDTIAGLGRDPAADPGTEVCQAAVTLTGADIAVLVAPQGETVRVVTAAGVDLSPSTLTPDLVPDGVRRAVSTRRVVLVPDAEDLGDHDAAVSAALGMRSWAHQPAGRGTGPPGIVLCLGWSRPQRRWSAQVGFALPLLAMEAAAAVERTTLVERLDAMARQDPLTGLLNRRAWDDQIDRELQRVGRTGRPLSVAVLDLDRFKAFNDAYGHLIGDQLLKGAAGAWSGALRASDVLARWGGEEFAVLMPETDQDQARAVLTRMAERTPMEQTFSAGLTTTTTLVDASLLMRAADDAVYRAKDAGRDRIEVGAIAVAATTAGSRTSRPPTNR